MGYYNSGLFVTYDLPSVIVSEGEGDELPFFGRRWSSSPVAFPVLGFSVGFIHP